VIAQQQSPHFSRLATVYPLGKKSLKGRESRNQNPAVACFYSAAKIRKSGALSPSCVLALIVGWNR
jgi:hypothetical protein